MEKLIEIADSLHKITQTKGNWVIGQILDSAPVPGPMSRSKMDKLYSSACGIL